MVGKKTARIGISEIKDKIKSSLMSDGVKVTKRLADEMCTALFGAIKDELKKGAQVNIREFGTFSIGIVPEKTIRDFRTKQIIKIPPHKRIYFKPSKTVNLDE